MNHHILFHRVTDRWLIHVVFAILFFDMSGNLMAQWKLVSQPSLNASSFLSYGTRLFAVTQSDVFLTSDDGQQWFPTALGDSGANGALAQMGGTIFAGGNGVWRSDDSGLSWYAALPRSESPWAITGLAAIESRLLLSSSWDGVYYSDDMGQTWVFDSPPIDASNFNLIKNVNSIILTQGEADVRYGRGGVARSSDAGNTWQRDLLQNNIRAFASLGNVFFLCGDSGVYQSKDSGLSWNRVSSISDTTVILPRDTVELFTAIAVFGSNLFVGSKHGVFLSRDTAKGWVSENENLPDTGVQSLAINGVYLYAGTFGAGVWRRPLSEMIPFNDVAQNSSSNPGISLHVFPNPAAESITVEAASGPVTIFDPLGRSYTVPMRWSTLDVSSLAPGVYFISDGVSRAKFVKE